MPDEADKATETISLSEVESDLGIVTTLDKEVVGFGTIQDRFDAFKLRVGWIIIYLFVATNVVVLGLVICLSLQDYHQVLIGTSGYERVIDSKVMLALIGATMVEIGALALGLGKHLFPVS